MNRERNTCRGLFLGTLFALPIDATFAWLVQLVWNAARLPHIGYWQALLGTLVASVTLGAIIGGLEMRKARKP